MISSSPPSSYVVQAGDTLSGIAEEFLGNANAWPAIFNANRGEIHNPNLIYPGQRLALPRRHWSGRSVQTTGYTSRHSSGQFSGTLSCSGLEMLWMAAGGRPGAAFMAAEIAQAESSGQEYATGPYGERGYWQINPVNGYLSTYDPMGNAHAAIVLSYDGTNWSAWTTYTSGAYQGRC